MRHDVSCQWITRLLLLMLYLPPIYGLRFQLHVVTRKTVVTGVGARIVAFMRAMGADASTRRLTLLSR